MDDFEKKIIEAGVSVSMTPSEREHIRARLLSHVQKKSILSPYLAFFSSPVLRHGVSFAFIAVLFFTGGLSAIADKSLPGTFLYPLKVGVNEKVLSLFATSPDSKKQLQITLAQRRLKEAEEIAQNPHVSEEMKKEFNQTLNKQIEEALVGEEEGVSTDETSAATKVQDTALPAGEAPTASLMMMSAPVSSEPVSSLRAAEKKMMVAAQPEFSLEEMQKLRSRIDTLREELSQKKKKAIEFPAITIEAKLLKAQKSLFDAQAASTTLIQKESLVREAERFISQSEKLLQGSEKSLVPPYQLDGSTQEGTSEDSPSSKAL